MSCFRPSISVRLYYSKPSLNGQHKASINGHVTQAKENTGIPNGAAKQGRSKSALGHLWQVKVTTEDQQDWGGDICEGKVTHEDVIGFLEGTTFGYYDSEYEHVTEEREDCNHGESEVGARIVSLKTHRDVWH